MKSCKSHEKKLNKEHQTLSFQFFINKSSNLMFFVLFCFFVRFARFQILICKPQSIWSKLLILSWLYCKIITVFTLLYSFQRYWNGKARWTKIVLMMPFLELLFKTLGKSTADWHKTLKLKLTFLKISDMPILEKKCAFPYI